MVTTIIYLFLWIPDILKVLCNVLYESILKAYFFINIGFFKYPMSLTIVTNFHGELLNSVCVKT
jgi:hypothetical protein